MQLKFSPFQNLGFAALILSQIFHTKNSADYRRYAYDKDFPTSNVYGFFASYLFL